jgi:hypothetical protein
MATSATTTELHPRPTHREEGRIRLCAGCGAYMRSFTNQDRCDPCRKGETDELTTDDVLDRINALPFRQRAAAFDAMRELHAEQTECLP